MSKKVFNFSFFIGVLAGVLLSGLILIMINTVRNDRLSLNNSPIIKRLTYPSTEVAPAICLSNDTGAEVLTTEPANDTNKGKIDINSASIVELESLPGIGPEKANAIIQFRNDYGFFLSLDELNYVPGISENMIEQFRQLVIICPAN